jgi:2-oxoglutarate dehydrogenase E2 component (dihydrolipoamide succinyltransferase)
MVDVVMPQLGESVTEGTITRWFKQVGENVSADEPLFEVSTDKVDTEVPAPLDGVLTAIRVSEGDTVDVGTVVAAIGASAEEPPPEPASADTQAPIEDQPERSRSTELPAAQPETLIPDRPPQAAADRLSPLVRRLLQERKLDPSTVVGSGAGGRITRDDVLAAGNTREIDLVPTPNATPSPRTAPSASETARAPTPEVDGVDAERGEPFNKVRRLTGEAMVASKAVAPHTVTIVEVDYERVEQVRRAQRGEFKSHEGFSLTYLPFISRALVDAIREFPHMNASVGDGRLQVHERVHLAIAVDLNFQGLVAPVVRDASDKRLRAIARDINDLAGRARSKKLSPDDLSGGTFTISNSGSYGTLAVIPIINQPQVAILSTDGVSRRPVVVTDVHGNESIAIHSVGNLTLSWDHRAFDGAYAAAFTARLKEILETRDWAAEL